VSDNITLQHIPLQLRSLWNGGHGPRYVGELLRNNKQLFISVCAVSISVVNDHLFANYLTSTRLCIAKNDVWRLQSGRNLWTFCWKASLVPSRKELSWERKVTRFPTLKFVSEYMVSHRKELVLGVVSANRVYRESELRERTVTYRSIWEISVTVSRLILLISFISPENILPGRNFNICNNVRVFLLFIIFKGFAAYFNGTTTRKNVPTTF
jgi:hypothetical protein